jgi:excisionase family DNA binding protein
VENKFVLVSSEELKSLIKAELEEFKATLGSSNAQTPEIMDVPTLANSLNCSERHIHSMIDRGVLNGYYLGTRLYLRYSEVIEALKQHKKRPKTAGL